jgi:HK97 family phage major capsid protein
MKDQIINMRRKLGELASEMAAVAQRITGITSAAEATNDGKGRPLTDEEASQTKALREQFASLRGREDEIKAAIEIAEEAERRQLAHATPAKTSGSGIELGKDHAEERPWGHGDARLGFAEFIQAVHKAEPRVDGRVDPRLRPLAAAGTNEGIGSEGGFLLAPTAVGLIDKMAFDSAELASRCMPIEVSDGSNSVEIDVIDETSRALGSRYGGLQVYHAAEGAEVTAKKPKFRKVTTKLEKIMGLWYVSDEQLEDTAYIASVGAQGFAEEIAFQIDEDIFAGTGAGMALGILNSAALVSIAKETGQDAATIWSQNVRKMLARMPPRSRKRGIWLVHQDVESEMIDMGVLVGVAGQPVYLPAAGYQDAPPARLFNMPVLVNEHSKALGSKGDIVLADLGWYAHVRKAGVKVASSIHVRFVYDESAIRFTTRVNGLPLLSSSITPAQGSNAISPFITLDARE